MLTPSAVIAANRFGLGARPGDRERIGPDPRTWLAEQLASHPPPAKVSSPSESANTLVAARQLRLARQVATQARVNQRASGDDSEPPGSPGVDEQVIREFREFIRARYLAQCVERHRLAVESERPFVERLVHFWSNHFAVSADKLTVAPIAGLYEREAIRPHVLGNFLDLLRAAEQHPAMILYLDNQASMGPSSTAAGFVRRMRGRDLGLNENLAREILELHTLGVDGGYGQADVTELAKVLTGWSIGGEIGPAGGRVLARFVQEGGVAGEFHFRTAMHEPGTKTVLGRTIREKGVEEGDEVLRLLAHHPATARHLAMKLARHFVADDPPAALVERMTQTYLDTGGELAAVYHALIGAKEAWDPSATKFKTPEDFAISTYRALGQPPDNLEPVTAFLTQAGQRPFTPGSPAGWSDYAAAWDGGDALVKRIEWAGAIGRRVGDRVDPVALADDVLGPLGEHSWLGIRGAESRSQGLALLLSSPEFQRR